MVAYDLQLHRAIDLRLKSGSWAHGRSLPGEADGRVIFSPSPVWKVGGARGSKRCESDLDFCVLPSRVPIQQLNVESYFLSLNLAIGCLLISFNNQHQIGLSHPDSPPVSTPKNKPSPAVAMHWRKQSTQESLNEARPAMATSGAVHIPSVLAGGSPRLSQLRPHTKCRYRCQREVQVMRPDHRPCGLSIPHHNLL